MKNLKAQIHIYKKNLPFVLQPKLYPGLYLYVGICEQELLGWVIPEGCPLRFNDDENSYLVHVRATATRFDEEDFFERYNCYNVINVDFLIKDLKKTTYVLPYTLRHNA